MRCPNNTPWAESACRDSLSTSQASRNPSAHHWPILENGELRKYGEAWRSGVGMPILSQAKPTREWVAPN